MAESTKLNLGCGHKYWPGYINVDYADNYGVEYTDKRPDVVSDLRKLPFENDYADEVHAIHVIEHFYVWEIAEVMKEWRRVLKPEGMMVLEFPCMEKILVEFSKEPLCVNTTWYGLYGEPTFKNPVMVHKWCYSIPMIKKILEEARFKDIKIAPPKFHKMERDVRVTAIKPYGKAN